MYEGQIVFSQLMDFLPEYQFQKCVDRYKGDNPYKKLFMLGSIPLHGICSTHVS